MHVFSDAQEFRQMSMHTEAMVTPTNTVFAPRLGITDEVSVVGTAKKLKRCYYR